MDVYVVSVDDGELVLRAGLYSSLEKAKAACHAETQWIKRNECFWEERQWQPSGELFRIERCVMDAPLWMGSHPDTRACGA